MKVEILFAKLLLIDFIGFPHQFKVMTPKKSFIICAATKEEQTQWILHIQKYSKECERKSNNNNNFRSMCRNNFK